MNSTTIVIGVPSVIAEPVVAINAPSAIGSCNSLHVDVSASLNFLGRHWKSVSITVHFMNQTNATIINTWFKANINAYRSMILPEYLFMAGDRYVMFVTLCNFLDKCGSGIHLFTVYNLFIPNSIIVGNNNRVVIRKKFLSAKRICFQSNLQRLSKIIKSGL